MLLKTDDFALELRDSRLRHFQFPLGILHFQKCLLDLRLCTLKKQLRLLAKRFFRLFERRFSVSGELAFELQDFGLGRFSRVAMFANLRLGALEPFTELRSGRVCLPRRLVACGNFLLNCSFRDAVLLRRLGCCTSRGTQLLCCLRGPLKRDESSRAVALSSASISALADSASRATL